MAALVLPDGTPIAVTGSEDGRVWVWDLTTHTTIGRSLNGHILRVSAVAALALPDGTLIAVTGSEAGGTQPGRRPGVAELTSGSVQNAEKARRPLQAVVPSIGRTAHPV